MLRSVFLRTRVTRASGSRRLLLVSYPKAAKGGCGGCCHLRVAVVFLIRCCGNDVTWSVLSKIIFDWVL